MTIVNPDFEPTLLARPSLLLIDYAVNQGMQRQPLLDIAGLTAERMADPDSRINIRSILKIWLTIDDNLNEATLGLNIGRDISAAQLGLVGYTMYHSRDLRSALYRLSHYMRILSEAVVFTIDESGDEVTLVWRLHPAMTVLRHPAELGVTLVVAMAREITGTELVPIRVELSTPSPDSTAAYRAMFRCPVLFGRPTASVTFSHQQMALAAKATDPTLAGYLDQLAEKTMAPLVDKDDNAVATVRRKLWAVLPSGRPNLSSIASDMGVSERTLQRRLDDEGSSFSAVLDALRRDLSHELLGERKRSVAETAFLLGYSEPSAFQRAFRRWHSVSPRRFRSS